MMTWDFFFRLLVAGVLGAIIGLDREYRAKEAGFRTHFLVALGSALFMIVSKYGFWDILGNTGIGLDPSRIAAQVVSGIGFLGAGTIIIQKLFVRGLTTAAGIWATSAIGLAVGAGQYWLGISAMLLTLLGLDSPAYTTPVLPKWNADYLYNKPQTVYASPLSHKLNCTYRTDFLQKQ